MKKIVKYWIPVILWMGFTFLMSTGLLSGDNTSHIIVPILRFLMPSISPHQLLLLHAVIRKLAHLTEYFVLSLLLFRAFRNDSAEEHPWRWVFSSIIILALFAASDEIHQSFVVTRTASIVDVGIDTLGGLLAQCMCIILHYARRRKDKSA
jgi:VanZ family protein